MFTLPSLSTRRSLQIAHEAAPSLRRTFSPPHLPSVAQPRAFFSPSLSSTRFPTRSHALHKHYYLGAYTAGNTNTFSTSSTLACTWLIARATLSSSPKSPAAKRSFTTLLGRKLGLAVPNLYISPHRRHAAEHGPMQYGRLHSFQHAQKLRGL